MITTINKDILTVDKGVIVHSVNCIGGVGGLAGAIARKWPKNAEQYRAHVKRQTLPIMLLGSVFEVNVAHNVVVANLFGQNNVGTRERQTEYSALIAGFKSIAQTRFIGNDTQTFITYGMGDREFPIDLTDIYIPYKIGCGLGGGEWNIVEEIINKAFEKSFNDVYICRYEIQ
jgi:O-acetyl-ADP-ribose deacetylase (regulator of RNase III)